MKNNVQAWCNHFKSLPLVGFLLIAGGVGPARGAHVGVKKSVPAKVAPAVLSKPLAPDESDFTIDPQVSVVTLRMSHSITGRFDTSGKNSLTGKIEVQPDGKVTAVKLEFKPDSLESLISLRDEHIKKSYLETAKFPVVTLENIITQLGRYEESLQTLNAPKKSTSKKPSAKPFSAQLVARGNRAPVTGVATVYVENDVLRGHAEFQSKISNFSIRPPRYMGVGVLDEFTVLVDFYARPDIGEDDVIGAGEI